MSFTASRVRVRGHAINNTRDQYNAGGDQYNHNVYNLDDTTKILSLLAEKAAANAFLDAEQRFPLPNCHVGTRTRILAEISRWVEDGSKRTRVFWLHGTAGVGKSAIAQTLAQNYVGTRLAAAFFFSRNDPTRDNLAPFVASIVYQFSKFHQLWSVLGPTIINTIRSDPKLFESTLENQFQKLIVEPCSQMVGHQDLPNVIVIDGLDECLRSSFDSPTTSAQKAIQQSRPPHERPHERLLALIRNVTTAYPRIPWIFLVFSRPEPQIRHAFTHKGFGMVLTQLAVTSSPEARRDIRGYLVDKFIGLRKKYRQALRYEDASWPGDNSIDRLADRADGQFIFIFRIYVDRDSDSPYSDLDLLYHEVLSHCRERWEKAQPVLRLLATRRYGIHGYGDEGIHWRSSSMIALLLNLKKGEVGMLLSRLHAVLNIPGDDDSDIYIAHASFNEFLSDKHRSADYHAPEMSEEEYDHLVVTCLLQNLSILSSHYPPSHPQCNFVATLQSWKGMLQSNIIKYSCMHWDEYCVGVQTPRPGLLAALNEFDPYCAMAARIEIFGYIRLETDDVVRWARSFGRATQDFVRTYESFSQGFCIDFVPMIPWHEAFWFTFELETDCWNSGEELDEFQVTLLQRLYATGTGKGFFSRNHSTTIVISPADTSSCTRLPFVTQINGEVFSRVCYSLRYYQGGQALLLGDIRNDTCQTVLKGLVKEDDLVHLKQFLKERRELFFPQYDDWPRKPSPMQLVNEPFSGDPSSFDPLRSTNLSPTVAIQDHNVDLSLPNSAPEQIALTMPTGSRPLPLLREDYGDFEVSTEGSKRKLAPSDEESNEDTTYKRTRT